MSSLPSLVARGCLRSRNLNHRLTAFHVRPSLHRSGISTATLSVPRDGGLLPKSDAAMIPSSAIDIDQEQIFGAVKEDPFAMRLPAPATSEPFRDLGIPRPLRTALQREFSHVQNPTLVQKDLLHSVLKEGKDVFLKDQPGQGKTFALALIALSRALKTRSKRSKVENSPRSSSRTSVPAAPSILLLLPHATLVRQVGNWMERLESSMSSAISVESGKGRLFRTVLPGEEQRRDLETTPEIIVSSPDALLTYLEAPTSRQTATDGERASFHVTSASLSRSLGLVMIDEADVMLRPLPGRFKTFSNEREKQRHPFFRHPPSIVRLLEDIFAYEGERSARKKQVQTVWCSATLNSVIRGFVHRSGWIRKDERVIVDTAATQVSNPMTGKMSSNANDHDGTKKTAHYCLTIDPLTGSMRNLGGVPTEPSFSQMVETAPDDPAASEKVHPLMVESLALLHASRSAVAGVNSSVSLVIVPEGASVPKLQASLQSLGVQSTILDGQQDPDAANLLLVARSHVRGLDIPNISAVYLLNGLDVTSLSKSARSAGGVEERKREYTHFAGRMGRLGARNREEGEDEGERYALVGLVMRDSVEEKAMRAMFAEKVALEVEVLKGEGIND